jgi:hypothetical protein
MMMMEAQIGRSLLDLPGPLNPGIPGTVDVSPFHLLSEAQVPQFEAPLCSR